MIPRSILPEAQFALSQFRALCITGPRQSGKTTLSKFLFKDRPYINFEDPTVQFQFQENPSRYLAKFKNGAILDEVQRVPEVFRYLQLILDKKPTRGQFILTGSNNFLLQEQVSQTLAGRAGYLTLLPLSFEELKGSGYPVNDLKKNILTGGYPEIWAEKLHPQKWLESYIQTYLQRDVRQLRNITNLALFNRFVQLCANHAGQILNREVLANQTGVDTKTIQAWLGLLETSYIIFQLQPWHNNLNKRIIKSPKLYFYDTGLLCVLLKIHSKEALSNHHLYGALFENWCISEIYKNQFNRGAQEGLFYLRDSSGNEIDLIVEKDTGPLAIEIKSTTKSDSHQPAGLKFWRKNQPGKQGLMIYQGKSLSTAHPDYNLLSWTNIDSI